ncbi:hypothetical protein M0R89_02370 [Halorussus limi]|uniref:Uncharacterized protein n=1 Tax=Halorussus limi TaxID=2938695 RepID=A0A8U0HV23_9EURY|nr:hypothetical protein [Halorussus limi]UPV74922.1 hypothetical protein M0R89_02370 [Halorussus limi]
MTESTLQNESNSAIGSPAEAGEATAGRTKLASLYDQYREHTLTTPFEVLGFWSAIALPFLYVPLLFNGISSTGESLTFVGLLALNFAALLAGHGHKRE